MHILCMKTKQTASNCMHINKMKNFELQVSKKSKKSKRQHERNCDCIAISNHTNEDAYYGDQFINWMQAYSFHKHSKKFL